MSLLGLKSLVFCLFQFIADKMRDNSVWKNLSESEFDNAIEGMEKLVMNRLFSV